MPVQSTFAFAKLNRQLSNLFPRTLLLLWGFLLLASACQGQKRKGKYPQKANRTAPAPPAVQKPVLVASIEMGACMGRCPQYRALIYRPGRMEYFGQRNMPRNDTLQYKLMDGFVATLLQEAKRIRFAALPDSLPTPPDAPVVRLFVYLDGRRKTVRFAQEAAPDELRQFARHFHENVVAILEEQEPLPRDSEEGE